MTKLTALRHRVARVGRDVHQHLLELNAIGADRRQCVGELDLDDDVLADQPLQHAAHGPHHFVDVDVGRAQDLLAAEGEQLTRQLRGAIGGACESRSGRC